MYAQVFQTEVVLSVGSGNGDDFIFPCNNVTFPANYDDRWSMCVGSGAISCRLT